MISLYVILKSVSILIEYVSIQPTNEADILHVFDNFALLVSQLRKRIDDHTKNYIDQDNVDECKECNVINDSENVFAAIACSKGHQSHWITNTTTISQAQIDALDETMEETTSATRKIIKISIKNKLIKY